MDFDTYLLNNFKHNELSGLFLIRIDLYSVAGRSNTWNWATSNHLISQYTNMWSYGQPLIGMPNRSDSHHFRKWNVQGVECCDRNNWLHTMRAWTGPRSTWGFISKPHQWNIGWISDDDRRMFHHFGLLAWPCEFKVPRFFQWRGWYFEHRFIMKTLYIDISNSHQYNSSLFVQRIRYMNKNIKYLEVSNFFLNIFAKQVPKYLCNFCSKIFM